MNLWWRGFGRFEEHGRGATPGGSRKDWLAGETRKCMGAKPDHQDYRSNGPRADHWNNPLSGPRADHWNYRSGGPREDHCKHHAEIKPQIRSNWREPIEWATGWVAGNGPGKGYTKIIFQFAMKTERKAWNTKNFLSTLNQRTSPRRHLVRPKSKLAHVPLKLARQSRPNYVYARNKWNSLAKPTEH